MNDPFDIEAEAKCLECGSEFPLADSEFCAFCEAQLGLSAAEQEQDDEQPSQLDDPGELVEPGYFGFDREDPRNDEEDDDEDYCDVCAGLLDDDGCCPNLECASAPCLQCGGDQALCECPPLEGYDRMRLRHQRERERDLVATLTLIMSERSRNPADDFSSPEEFARHLARRRQHDSVCEDEFDD